MDNFAKIPPMRSKNLQIKNAQSFLKFAQDEVLKCRKNLQKQFIKLDGRNFGLYQSKEIDRFFKYAYEAVKTEYFDDFYPPDEKIPFVVIAIGSYAFCEVSVKSSVDFAVIYKTIQGFNCDKFSQSYVSFLEKMGLDLSYKIYEISELFDQTKDNIELKTLFAQIRFVSGSKKLYITARDEINRLKSYKKDEFIKYHLEKLSPFDDIKFLSQCPDLKNGYGGFYDFKRIFWLLNSICDQNPKIQALKFLSEDEFASLSLSADFISSLRSALQISGGENILQSSFLQNITELMQIKEKKMLNSQILLLVKMLFAMQNITIYSRFLARCAFGKYFKSNLSFSQKKFCKNGKFFIINNVVHSPIHAKKFDLPNLLKSLNNLPDLHLKFSVETIVLFQKTQINKKDIDTQLNAFLKIFYRDHSFGILKALLDGEILFSLVKPMEHTRHLARLEGYKFSVDEYSLLCVRYIENIKDDFVKSLYDELCLDSKALLKLVAFMHEVALNLGGDHNVMGANIFRAYASKLNLNSDAINLGVTLIKNHSLMNAITLGKQSKQDILTFISHIGDKKTLKMLYILTYAMVSATNDGYYSPINAKILRQLYENAANSFENSDKNLLDIAAKRAKKENLIKKQKTFLELNDANQNKILGIKSNLLFVQHQAIDIINTALWAKDCANIAINLQNKNNFCLQMIVKQGWNMIMLLNKLNHLDLEYMEIFELFDDKFFVKLQYSKKASQNEMKSMQNTIISALCDKTKPNLIKPQIKENEFKFEPLYSPNYAKFTINAKDQRGFMAFVLSVFEKFDLKVANARIQTIKNRTRNLFLIEKNANLDDKFDKIKEILTKE